MAVDAIAAENLTQAYGKRTALDNVSFRVARGEIFGLLGPNGGGKTTLFRILSTLIRPASGDARIFGASLKAPARVRSFLGVVFQKPSLDGKLTVRENLICHGQLYGMARNLLRLRTEELLTRLGLADRGADLVETLSGGLQRRTELAKALLHRPPLLLLDEPSTGLDPGARRDFMSYLKQLRDSDGMTIVLTTHYMEEAERCDKVGILHQGHLVRVAAPSELKAAVGGDVIVIQGPSLEPLAEKLRTRFHFEPQLVDGTIRFECLRGHEIVRDIVEAFPEDVTLLTYGKPTLEDVFIHLTGHRFWSSEETSA